jgi:cyclophilin family peptidyl-prolyl cis-trans isomerase
MRQSRVTRRLVVALPAAFVLAGLVPPLLGAQRAPARSAAKSPAIVVAPGTEAVVETAKGSFTIRLLPEIAPWHAALFVKTAKAGGYDGTTFHRVIAGGIIQGGDPLSKDPAKAALYGTGGLDILKAELSDRPFVRGTVAAVRKPSNMDSAGKQFFICLRDQPSLKGQYTIFGEVVSGIDVVDQISLAPAEKEKARERVEMKVVVREPQPTPAP